MLTPTPGLIVGGKYRILRALGQGGMGAVFEAENTITLKRAAIKWLHPRLAGSEVGRRRLLQEARAMSRVRHPHVVELYDVVQEDDELFLVMELLIGELLSDRLARAPLAVCELVALLLPTIDGVAAAHAAGVIHRDIKPANIFLAQTSGARAPTPKVIDFGISKTFDAERGQLTASGTLLGTPRYISFEQLRGDSDLDGRSDVYAFGVLLYEALVGRPPYSATTFGEQAIQFVSMVPRAPKSLRRDLPEELDALVRRAVARDRSDRLPSLIELADALRPFAESTRYPGALVWMRPAEGFIPSSGAACGEKTKPAFPVPHMGDSRAPSLQSHRERRWFVFALIFALVLVGPLVAGVSRKADIRTDNTDSSSLPHGSPRTARTAQEGPRMASVSRVEHPTSAEVATQPSHLLSGNFRDGSLPYSFGKVSEPLPTAHVPAGPTRKSARGRRRTPAQNEPTSRVPSSQTPGRVGDVVNPMLPEATEQSPHSRAEKSVADILPRAGSVRRDEF